MVQRDSAVPPWQQVRLSITRKISDGSYPPGHKLPGILALASEYEVAPMTVRKAIKALRDEDHLIVTHSGWGTFVRET
jgi:GntR family transcriptional regulator